MHQGKLSGKTAIVTGASKGIGAAIAKRLAAEGAAVCVNYASSREGAERTASEIIAAGGRAVAIQADTAVAADVERLFTESAAAFGPLDILVNNAGVYEVAVAGGIGEDHFHRLFNINVLGVILCLQEALRHFRPEGGVVVNTSSIVSTLCPAGTGVYNATKAAVDALTRTFAKELGSRKIRVNCVSPGPVETEGAHAQGFMDGFQKYAAVTPLGRVGQPEDIAAGVAFLASEDAHWMTGETMYLSGGLR